MAAAPVEEDQQRQREQTSARQTQEKEQHQNNKDTASTTASDTLEESARIVQPTQAGASYERRTSASIGAEAPSWIGQESSSDWITLLELTHDLPARLRNVILWGVAKTEFGVGGSDVWVGVVSPSQKDGS